MYICTTRFNTKTYKENVLWKLENNYKGCIYGVPHRIADYIPIHKKMLVIEMHNDFNLITGLGVVENYIRVDKKYKIYKDPKYNRYIYRGKKHIMRNEIDPYILEQLEYILFKTSNHCKRLRGITRISVHNFGKTIDNDYYVGTKVKKISGNNKGKVGVIIDKKGDKVRVIYDINKIWSLRYIIGNYVKVVEKKEEKPRKKREKREKRIYKCSLCGELKANHTCIAIKNDNKLKNIILNYFKQLLVTTLTHF
jgi:hypothetical protein